MGLGNAGLAGLLALAALPILVHLMFRRRARTVPFPSLRLLRTMDPHLARRRRLHEILLLALRTAALLLAVLTVLRPWSGASESGPVTADRVVLLDDSASMALGGDAPAFADAVAAARGVFERMRPGDRGALHLVVGGAAAPREGLTQDARMLRRALDGLERSDGRGSLAAAVRRAGEALARGTSPNRRVVLVTDLEAGSLSEPDLAAAVRALPERTGLVVARVAKPAAAGDLAVTKLVASAGACVVGRPFRVVATIERRRGAAAAARVHLAAGSGVPETRETPLGAAGVAEVSFEVTPAVAGPLAVEAALDADDFRPNDRRRLVVTARPKVAVALVDGDGDDPASSGVTGGALLALALDPPGDGSLTGIHVRRRGPAEADVAEVSAADVLVLHDAPDMPGVLADAVLARHRAGAGLLVVAGPRAARAGRAAPEALEPVLPARVRAAPSAAGPMPLSVSAPDDPVLSGLRPPGAPARLEGVTVRGVLETAWRPEATTLLHAGGRPVLLGGAGGPALVLLFAAPLDPASTNWGLRPTFVAWLHGVVPLLARGGSSHPSVVAGESNGPRFVARAGVYDLDRGDAAFAANADLREADPARLDDDAARSRFGGVATVVSTDDLVAAVHRGARSDWTGLLLALAGAALLAETILSNAARKRLSLAARDVLARPGRAVA